jgi:signal transduction histidine kinase
MGQIVDEVLTLAREGRDVDERAAVDIADTAREAWDTVETEGARLDVAVTGTVWADRSSLRTIFENLFRNAVEHATARDSERAAPERSDGGEATVRVGYVDGGFYVEDDGPGIPDGKRDRVFEHGYTTTDEGTGFGLAIVEAVAERHGWRIELTDAPDGGARFVFRSVWIEPDD